MGTKLGVLLGAIGLAAALLHFAQRLSRLEGRIDALERRRPPSRPAASRSETTPVDVVNPPPSSFDVPKTVQEGTSTTRNAPPTSEAFTPAQREAVAREVERVLKERGPAPFAGPRAVDVPSLLEKDLGLSPAQKLKIEELWRKRDEDLMKVAREGPGEGGFAELSRKIQAVEARWDEQIKRELDFNQAQAFERLKKEGRLHGAVMIQLEEK